MKHVYLDIPDEWRGTMGKLPESFVGIVFGFSGHGKTEFCLRLAFMLLKFGKVAWFSYEQGHDSDIQEAVIRNNFEQFAKQIQWIDPNSKRNTKMTRYEELDLFLSRKQSPKYVFIDSYDYARFTEEEYQMLKEKHGKKKGIVFIAWTKDKYSEEPKKAVAKSIMFDGKFAIFVKNFIARPVKSRLQGWGDFIVHPEKAREREPLYFGIQPDKPAPKKRGRKKKTT